jgi:hypothetical protein
LEVQFQTSEHNERRGTALFGGPLWCVVPQALCKTPCVIAMRTQICAVAHIVHWHKHVWDRRAISVKLSIVR